MDFEWDLTKASTNWGKHRVSFKLVARFEWETALEWRDERQPYEEVRTAAIGFIGRKLHVLIYTRRGRRCRVISLRRANRKEIMRYAAF